ncbi:MAG: hypothetical protein L3J65_01365 [Robiginitomaculum sp.]|nr:hypothetical protein [Robiginitomaculum sp.]
MDGFIFFLIFIFVIVPIFKNIVGGKSTKKPTGGPQSGSDSNSGSGQKNWAEVQKLLQQKIQEQSSRQSSNKRDAQGHSGARKQARERLRSGKSNSDAFPESHMARVRKRDQRDRSERNRIEAMLHSQNNTSITRVSNKGVDGWGKRGDARSGGGGFLFLLLFSLIAIFVLNKLAPGLWTEIMRVFSN